MPGKRISLGAAACLTVVLLSHATAAPSISVADYRRAESMLSKNVRPKLLNASVDPVWMSGDDRFWYKHQNASGWDYLEVDPEKATKRAAFDQAALASAVSSVVGHAVDPSHLSLDGLRFADKSGTRIAFSTAGFDLACALPATCSGKKSSPEDTSVSVSPDGHWAAFARDDNLWLRDLKSGKERQLTRDGEPHFSYGKMPDSTLMRVISQTRGFHLPLYGVDWSPDSRHIVVDRADERRLPDYYFLQLVPYDGDRYPHPVTVRSPLSGYTNLASAESSVIDVTSGSVKHIDVDGGLSSVHFWDPSGARFVVMHGGDYSRTEALYEVAVSTGKARRIIGEESRSFLQISPLEYDEPALRFLPASNEMIWYSQRDGWDHLYLVDVSSGAIKAKITNGDWDIQNIVSIDEKARRIYFTAVGREAGEDPYWRHLYSASFDGSDLKLLTPEPADHVFPGRVNPAVAMALKGLFPQVAPANVSPDGRYVIDTYSTPQMPPVTLLRRADNGAVVLPLEKADESAVLAAGWIAPEPFTAKAVDGVTDLYGLFIRPANFDPSKKYPVIDAIYNGPQVVTTPHDFVGALSGLFMGDAQAFAQLGFAVVVLDGRGTPMRSKAFQDYIYNNMQEFGVEDHVAAIRALGARQQWMDLDRVGVFGHSFGGYTSMKAILGYPDFFKVAASSAGPYDLYGMYSLDAFFKPPVFANGASHPSGPADRPTNWGAIDLTQQADRLKGKLLLGFGDLDENAYPAEAARMVNALIKANKSFDLIYMPDRPHAFSAEPYFIRRRWDFFVKNLLGIEPPNDYRMGALP